MNFSIKYIVCLFVIPMALGGCDGMNDLHQKYLDMGEKVYAAQPDSVFVRPGNSRLRLDIYFTAQRIEKGVIFWNQGKDSTVFHISARPLFQLDMPNMQEGDYTYRLLMYDKFGNKSLPIEVVGKVYGENYIDGLINRGIYETYRSGNTATIAWKEVDFCAGVEVTYLDSKGETIVLIVPSGEDNTIIPDFKAGSTFSYVTLYRPQPDAIDVFRVKRTATYKFPS